MKSRSNCTIFGAGICMIAPLAAALILTTPASAQCNGDDPECLAGGGTCGQPPTGLCEGEVCYESGPDVTDVTNSGCNAEMPALTDFTEVTAVGTGPTFPDSEVFCGGISTFQVGPQCKSDADCDPPDEGSCENGLCTPANFRDTDWWRVPVSVLSDFDVDGDGRVLLNLRIRSEFDSNAFIIDIEDVELCDATTTLDLATALEAETGECGAPVEIEAVVDFSESPNGVAVVVTTDGIFGTGVPCDQRYIMEMWASDVLAVCDVGAGPCNASNGSPGCEDAECCALVCEEVDPSCCIITWGPQCADGAINAIGCAFEPYSCEAPTLDEPDCCDALSDSPPLLVTDGTVYNFDTTDTNNDGAPNEDPFCSGNTNTGLGKDIWFRWEADQEGTLTISTCLTDSPSAFDTLIEVYDGGNIGDAYDCEEIKGRAVQLFCNDTGGNVGLPADRNPCFDGNEVDNAHLHYEVTVGTQYIIRMAGFESDLGPCGPGGSDCGPGSITFNFVPGTPLFDTGPQNVVLFDGTPTNLGWISGAINETGLDTERRTAQAFELPPLPVGATEWEVTEILINGFEDGTDVNEQVHFEIFSRTPGHPDFPDWPGPEPTPADSLFVKTVPMVVGTENTAGPGGNDDEHAFDVQAAVGTPITLAPGPYWLAMWATNDNVPFQSSSLAWFTNAPDGVNNFCTDQSALDYPDTDPDQLGCATEPAGSPAMYRSRIYPPVDPPNDDTGFRSYRLTLTALDVDPDNDPDPDPADLYNASFVVRGIPAAAGEPCPYDCQNDGPDGTVGINDFLDLLATWQQSGVPCDVDPDDTGAGINDFLALLAAWGPCP